MTSTQTKTKSTTQTKTTSNLDEFFEHKTLDYYKSEEFARQFRRYCIEHEKDEPQDVMSTYSLIMHPFGSELDLFGGLVKAPNIVKATIIAFDDMSAWGCQFMDTVEWYYDRYLDYGYRTDHLNKLATNFTGYLYERIKPNGFVVLEQGQWSVCHYCEGDISASTEYTEENKVCFNGWEDDDRNKDSDS